MENKTLEELDAMDFPLPESPRVTLANYYPFNTGIDYDESKSRSYEIKGVIPEWAVAAHDAWMFGNGLNPPENELLSFTYGYRATGLITLKPKEGHTVDEILRKIFPLINSWEPSLETKRTTVALAFYKFFELVSDRKPAPIGG